MGGDHGRIISSKSFLRQVDWKIFLLSSIMAFNATSRSELKEAAGYESFVCRQAVNMGQLHQGVASPLTLIINDAEPHEMKMSFTDDFSAGARVEVLQLFSPLLFVSAFKLLDLYEEWVLNENARTHTGPFWSFKQKVTQLSIGTLARPDFLAHDTALSQAVDTIFKKLVSKRNAITHNHWGNSVGGNLHFDYVHDSTLVKETVPFEVVLTLADFANVLFDSMVHPSIQTAETMETLRFLANKLAAIHGQPPFTVAQPRLFKVVRRTSRDEVDLAFIRSEIEKQSQGKSYKYTLKIRSVPTGEEWDFHGDRFADREVVTVADIRAGSI
jgi:hypothetical protein